MAPGSGPTLPFLRLPRCAHARWLGAGALTREGSGPGSGMAAAMGQQWVLVEMVQAFYEVSDPSARGTWRRPPSPHALVWGGGGGGSGSGVAWGCPVGPRAGISWGGHRGAGVWGAVEVGASVWGSWI